MNKSLSVCKRNRRRRLIFCRLFFMTVTLVGIILGAYSLSNSMQPDQFVEITVNTGDTLWGIATRFAGNQDPRKMIYSIKKVNQLDSGFITAGQVLRVPLYK